ncbi:MAG: peptide chain release factor N(5)-glutamine methyltransferase [Pseudomonadota bacterium]
MNDKTWKISQLLAWTTQYFGKNGVESPRLNAEVLLAHSLKTSRVGLYVDYDKPLERDELREYRKLVKRRIRREPLQYITGYQEFWSLRFKVTKGVLIPRRETEILVEEALKVLARVKSSPETVRILELGTGSGVIAATLAKELGGGSIIATDTSGLAIRIARENARTHGVEKHITFLQGSLFLPVRERVAFFDLVISNPPYIPSEEFTDLQPEVREFEPRTALDGGKEGLRFYRQILPHVGKYLAKDGWLMLEVGKGQAKKVTKLIESRGEFHPASTVKDLSGVDRVVTAQRKDRE